MSAAYANPEETAADLEPFEQADHVYETIKARLTSTELMALAHDEVERCLEQEGRELLRLLYEDHCALRGLSEVTEVVVGRDGRVHRYRRSEMERTIGSIFGPVSLPRDGYFPPQGGGYLFPVDADLNLPADKYSLEVRRRAAEYGSEGSFDRATKLLRETSGARPGKRQVEELIQRASVDFERFYNLTAVDMDPSRTGSIGVITVDAAGVVVREEALREATRKAAEGKRRHKLDKRLSKGEKRNRKRMAMVAAVYTIEPWVRTPDEVVAGLRGLREAGRESHRPRPEFKRLWASLVKDKRTVVDEAFEEALSRDPERTKTWVVLLDGDKAQIRAVRKAAKRHGLKVTIILDIIHVIEYLWRAAQVFHGDGTKEAEAWVAERLLRVLRGKAGHVAGGIRRAATKRGITGNPRKRLDQYANYLKNNAPYLHYRDYLEAGFPIATGVIEGACRFLVRDRMDITGARWGLAGAEAVLRLRALRASGDFEAYWEFHREQEYVRNHGSRYASDAHPNLARPSKHAHLRVVK